MTKSKKAKKILIVVLAALLIMVILLVGLIIIPQFFSKPLSLSYTKNDDDTYTVAILPDEESKISSMKTIKIPSTYEGKPVTKVKSPNTITSYTSINEIVVSDGVECIDDSAFSHLMNLKKLTLPSSIKSIGSHIALSSIELNFNSNDYFQVINGCIIETETNTAVFGLDGCTIPENITTIGKGAFWGATVMNTSMPTSITKIEATSFMSTTFNFEKLILTENIREVGNQAFSYVKGINSTVQISTTGSIHKNAFNFANIKTLIFDVKPNVPNDELLSFSSQITAYYENENIPQITTAKQIESDLTGYRKYRT